MTKDHTTECSTCGAVVAYAGKHRDWHDALDALLPRLRVELESREEERREGRTGKARFL